MRKWLMRGLRVAYTGLILTLPVAAIANYTATQGSGTNFGSVVIAGVHFMSMLICDATTANQCLAVSAGGAAKVDGSAVTQPVSGTVTANAGTNLNTSALATSANLTAGTQKTQIVDGSGNVIASTSNALNVAITSGAGSGGTAIADNAAFTLGTTSETPIGCYNGTATTTAAHVGIVGCTAAGSVHTTVDNTNANGSASSASSAPVVIASDQAAVAVKAASGAFVAGAIADLAHGQGSMLASVPVVLANNQAAADPCMFQAKTNLPISQNGTSSVQLIALSGSTSIYVCSLSLVAAGATTMALTTGTGTACVTSNAAVIGSTTANIANSVSFSANGGMTLGNGGGTIAKGAASSELCMVLGTSVYVSGNLTYVQQ